MINVSESVSFEIDKSNWIPTKLSSLAEDVSIRSDSSSHDDLTRFVGLEHFVTGDLTITKWGETGDLESSMKVFKKGDVLFARRNAYLRRASLVEFDGVCSGDALVLKENHKKIVPGFLAIILNSNELWNFANENAAGTMSKRVKWRDLGQYEVLLPEVERQQEISDLIWSNNELLVKYSSLKRESKNHLQAQIDFLLKNPFATLRSQPQGKTEQFNWKNGTIRDFIKHDFIKQIQDGNHGDIHPKASDYIEEGIPFIMANTISDGELLITKSKKLPQTITDKLRIGFSKPGDVLLSHKGTIGETTIVPDLASMPYIMLTPQVTYYRLNASKLLSKFLYYTFRSTYFQAQIKNASFQSTRAYIGITAQQNLQISIPVDIKDQMIIIQDLEKFENLVKNINITYLSLKKLQNSIINQIF